MIPAEGALFLLALAIFIAIGLAFSRDTTRKGMLLRVAGRVGGTFVEGTWFREARVGFRIAGRDAGLEFFAGSRGQAPYSRVSVSLGGLFPGTLHVLEDGFGRSFLKLFGAQDLSIGDASFDRDYVVKAAPAALAARVFSPPRRAEVIRTVRLLRGLADPSIDATPQQLTVTVRQYLRDETAVVALISAASEFLGYLLTDPGTPGVELGEVTTSGDGMCPVCGTGLRDRVVTCERCRTAHHAECWAYMGVCSTYACAGRRAG